MNMNMSMSMSNKFANRMERADTISAFAVSSEARAFAAKGHKVYPFHVGDLNLPTPSTIVEGAAKAIKEGKTGYCPSAGIPELRMALAEDVSRSHKVDYKMENVVVQTGGKPVIGKFFLTLMDRGDTVIYPDPGYPLYMSLAEFYGGKTHSYGYVESPEGLRMDFDAIEAGFAKGAKLFVYNNYNNPTSAASPPDEMERLTQLVREHDAYILADEAYFDMLYEGEGRSIVELEGMAERTVILYTFSKKFAMTGWRLGAAIAPKDIAAGITKMNVNDESCTNHFVQYAGVAGLQGPQDEVKGLLTELRRRRDAAMAELNRMDGVNLKTPTSTFYLWPEVSGLMARKGFTDVEAFRRAAMEATGVSFCSRMQFGRIQPGETGQYLRLAYSGIDVAAIAEGMARFREWAAD